MGRGEGREGGGRIEGRREEREGGDFRRPPVWNIRAKVCERILMRINVGCVVAVPGRVSRARMWLCLHGEY